MTWNPPYTITLPVADADRDTGETEIQKWGDVIAFITDATPLLESVSDGVGAYTGPTISTGSTEPSTPSTGDIWISTP